MSVADLSGNLPGTATTATTVEDVGMFSSNVVQTEIELGVAGDISIVKSTVDSVKAAQTAFSNLNCIVTTDENGVVLNFTGPG